MKPRPDIVRLQLQLRGRRMAVQSQAQALAGQCRRTLASPPLLWGAAALGLVLGQLLLPARPAAGPAQSGLAPAPAPARSRLARLLALVVDMAALVRVVASLLPAARPNVR